MGVDAAAETFFNDKSETVYYYRTRNNCSTIYYVGYDTIGNDVFRITDITAPIVNPY